MGFFRSIPPSRAIQSPNGAGDDHLSCSSEVRLRSTLATKKAAKVWQPRMREDGSDGAIGVPFGFCPRSEVLVLCVLLADVFAILWSQFFRLITKLHAVFRLQSDSATRCVDQFSSNCVLSVG